MANVAVFQLLMEEQAAPDLAKGQLVT